ncbi:hypothetical protein [Hyperthermus butylicus]|nr:hypothetical protein [Hyperthermus butylicus]
MQKSMTLITTEHGFVEKLLGEYGWRVTHKRRVAHGNLYPFIIVARP